MIDFCDMSETNLSGSHAYRVCFCFGICFGQLSIVITDQADDGG